MSQPSEHRDEVRPLDSRDHDRLAPKVHMEPTTAAAKPGGPSEHLPDELEVHDSGVLRFEGDRINGVENTAAQSADASEAESTGAEGVTPTVTADRETEGGNSVLPGPSEPVARPRRLPRPSKPSLLLAGILVLGAALRLYGLAWDGLHHLHPDERFMTTVATAIHWPTLNQWFDPRSPMNPNALPNVSYVYGTFSLFIVRGLAELIQHATEALLLLADAGDFALRLRSITGYDQIHLLGRLLSVVSDLLTIWLIYLLGRRVYGTSVGLLGALFGSLAVLMIQTTHFFTVEAPLTFLLTLAIYFAIRAAQSDTMLDWSIFGVATGLAAATKVSAFMLLAIGILAAGVLWYRATQVGAYGERRRFLYPDLVTGLFGFGMLAFVTFRLAQPYAFAGPGLFDLSPNAKFMDVFAGFQRIGTGEADVPFNHSWAGATPYLWQLKNMALWGLGIPLTIAAWLGFALACAQIARDPRRFHLQAIIVGWVGLNFLYWGIQFTKLMRYLLPIYPELLLLAAFFVVTIWRWADDFRARRRDIVIAPEETPPPANDLLKHGSPGAWDVGTPPPAMARTTRLAGAIAAYGPPLARIFGVLVVGWTALYALAFANIYARPVTRVTASQWIYENIPPGARVASEHWDDRLPLGLPGRESSIYSFVELGLYGDDNEQKRVELSSQLDGLQYIILSSNRLYGSIPKIPRRYPMTTRYYQALFSGELGFEQVAEFTSRPSLLGIELNDDDAEESFTVYDHPKVTIFRKAPAYSSENTRQILASVSLDDVLRGQRPANAASTGLLLTPSERAQVRAGGTWSDIFDRSSPVNSIPLLVWYLVVQLIGLAALPLTWWICHRLGDAGYALAKTIGVLVISYVPWLLASLHILPFSRASILLAVLLLVGASGLVVRRSGAALRRSLAARRVPIVATEAIFTVAFVGFLVLRVVNPDLWHSGYGGEKPMDFAYLNAVLKSDYFPPYDPWLAGGYINYYYFGQVIVGSLTKLSGILPWISYNLAIPTIAALTAMSVASAVYNLLITGPWARRSRQLWAVGGAVMGMLLAVVCGNLAGVVQIVEYFIKLDRSSSMALLPVITGIVSFFRGVAMVIVGPRESLPAFDFDFWGPTRVITTESVAPITEFPYFTFLYGDLHAHMIAMPIALLVVGLAINLVRQPERGAGFNLTGEHRITTMGAALLHAAVSPFGLTLLLVGLAIGVVRMTNSWDYPTYLGLVTAAIFIAERVRVPDGWVAAAKRTIGPVAIVLLASQVFVIPFLQRFELFYTGLELTKSTTIVPHYLIIMGFFLAVVAAYLSFQVSALWNRLGESSIALMGTFSASTRSYAVADAPSFMVGPRVDRIVLGACILGVLIAALFSTRGVPVVTMAGVWLMTIVLVAVLRRPSPGMQFTYLLAATALAVTAGVEIFVVKGDIGRMNTVFKFYLQAWFFLSIVSGVLLTLLARRAWGSRWLRKQPWRRLAIAAVVLPLLVTFLYPLLGTPSKLKHRFVELPLTLDGMAFMSQAKYMDRDKDMRLPDDFAAINWMLDNIQGTPVIVEGLSPLYHWRNRVANFTGLPAVVGWDHHQKQQRGDYGYMVEDRLKDVDSLYGSARPDESRRILNRYNVEYIYFGELERVFYPTAEQKFDSMVGSGLEQVYEQGAVTIYRVVR
jgi:YYY domain-containing protein